MPKNKLHAVIQEICDAYDRQKMAYRKKYNQNPNGRLIKGSDIIYARWIEKKTLKEIAVDYNVSGERIRQILTRIERIIFKSGKDNQLTEGESK